MKGDKQNVASLLTTNPYPGRGIVSGMSADGKCACFAYFIMGRSENSRNRVLEEREGALFTRAFDESKVKDPSLIIYPAMRRVKGDVIVTNGDQTDTVFHALQAGKGFFEALESREYEPDEPNYTPRISALLHLSARPFSYDMSILKRGSAGECLRLRYSDEGQAGVGHFIHTYLTDGNPLPSFEGDPKPVLIPAEIDAFAPALWAALDEQNKISFFVRYFNLETGEQTTRLFNKNQRSGK